MDDEQRTRWRVRLLTWTAAAVVLGVVVGLVYAVYPLLV
jgi:cell division septal protein FtsQ